MSTQSDIAAIRSVMLLVDANRAAKFAYTDTAFNNDIVAGVSAFDVNAEQNIPLDGYTDFNTTVLNKGVRTQGASLPRMSANHFFGRLSYNINKLAQKFLAWIDIDIAARAHNANEYDANAPYSTSDICYVVETVGGLSTVTYYIRTSSTPTTITGIAPTNTNHWASLPEKAVGYRHKYTIADLTGSSYATNTWYPVVTTLQDFEAGVAATKDGILRVKLEAYCNGVVAGYANAQRAELSVMSKFTGFANTSTDILLDDSCIDQVSGTDNSGAALAPIGYSKLPLGRQAVIWLKGGSKYALWNDFGSVYTLYTSSYSNGLDASIAPVTTRPLSVTSASVKVDVVGKLNGVQSGAGGLSLLALSSLGSNWASFLTATAPADLVIDSNAKLALLSSAGTGTYPTVVVKSGTFTYAGNLALGSRGVVRLIGEPGSKICINGGTITGSTTMIFGLIIEQSCAVTSEIAGITVDSIYKCKIYQMYNREFSSADTTGNLISISANTVMDSTIIVQLSTSGTVSTPISIATAFAVVAGVDMNNNISAMADISAVPNLTFVSICACAANTHTGTTFLAGSGMYYGLMGGNLLSATGCTQSAGNVSYTGTLISLSVSYVNTVTGFYGMRGLSGCAGNFAACSGLNGCSGFANSSGYVYYGCVELTGCSGSSNDKANRHKKMITGTTPSSSASSVTAAHGLDHNKILSVRLRIQGVSSYYPDNQCGDNGGDLYRISVYWNTTNIVVSTSPSNSSGAYSKSFIAEIEYYE